MGDEILKTIIILIISLILSSTLVSAKDNVVAEYDKLFTQISKKRIGVSNSKIDRIKNPFISRAVVKDDNSTASVEKPTHILTAIFNKRAKLNGRWYKLHSKIGDFKLISIGTKSVIMKNGHSKKELFIRNSDVNKIKFSSK